MVAKARARYLSTTRWPRSPCLFFLPDRLVACLFLGGKQYSRHATFIGDGPRRGCREAGNLPQKIGTPDERRKAAGEEGGWRGKVVKDWIDDGKVRNGLAIGLFVTVAVQCIEKSREKWRRSLLCCVQS